MAADNNKDLKLLPKDPVKTLKIKVISLNNVVEVATVDAVVMTRIEAALAKETLKIKIRGFTNTITSHAQPTQRLSLKSILNWKSSHQKKILSNSLQKINLMSRW